jgi:hypothetical protein
VRILTSPIHMPGNLQTSKKVVQTGEQLAAMSGEAVQLALAILSPGGGVIVARRPASPPAGPPDEECVPRAHELLGSGYSTDGAGNQRATLKVCDAGWGSEAAVGFNSPTTLTCAVTCASAGQRAPQTPCSDCVLPEHDTE